MSSSPVMSSGLVLDELGRLLGGSEPVSPGAALPPLPEDPVVSVEGLGRLTFPLSSARLKKLLAQGEPAPFGKGEQTLTDTSVRHTWHFPDAGVDVDWGGQLDAVLESARSALGLSPTTRLVAEFHSLLVYERGQFFAAHQDSQKDDAMVASLVVVLPNPFTGGELVVHDGPRSAAYAGSRGHATMVVFYADQVHEVLPVRTGNRLSLTYNIMLAGDSREQSVQPDRITDAATLLDRYFTTARTRFGRDLGTPLRLAYLLDHEYTPRGLSPSRLKGADASAAATLGAAAERADCEVVLALTDIHETRDASSSGDQAPWGWDGQPDDDGYDEDEGGSYDVEPDDEYLIAGEVAVTHWLTPEGTVQEAALGLDDDEVAAGTPTWSLRPYESEHEGYMGNYGNTVDRWYKRAALLIWPRRLAFTNRAEAAPAVAMREALVRLADPEDEAVFEDLRGMVPVWPAWVRHTQYGPQEAPPAEGAADLLTLALAVARFVDDTELGDALVEPFRIEHLRPEAVEHIVALAQTRGTEWARELLRVWFAHRSRFGASRDWFALLPEVCRAFGGQDELAHVVLDGAWALLREALTPYLTATPTTHSRRALAERAEPLAAVLRAATVSQDEAVRDEVVTFCQRAGLIDVVLPMLGLAHRWENRERAASGVQELAEKAASLLRERVDAPVRASDDWSITPPTDCGCELCATLGGFLVDPDARVLEWPIAKPKRQHIHQVIDRAELPVSHTTRRSGSPHKLVLTKTAEVFDREDRARSEARAALTTLAQQWGVG